MVAKYWDGDALCYHRNNVVSKEEQRRVPMQITAITEREADTFDSYLFIIIQPPHFSTHGRDRAVEVFSLI